LAGAPACGAGVAGVRGVLPCGQRCGTLLRRWSTEWRPGVCSHWFGGRCGRESGWTGELSLLRLTARPWNPVLASVEAPSLWRLAAPAELFSASLVGSVGAARLFSPAWRGWWQRGLRAPWSGCGGGGGLCAAVAPLLRMRCVCGVRAGSGFGLRLAVRPREAVVARLLRAKA
jgi:hypothetical protein